MITSVAFHPSSSSSSSSLLSGLMVSSSVDWTTQLWHKSHRYSEPSAAPEFKVVGLNEMSAGPLTSMPPALLAFRTTTHIPYTVYL